MKRNFATNCFLAIPLLACVSAHSQTHEADIIVSDKYVVLSEGEWVEYQLHLPAGHYEVWVTSGGNDSRQAAGLAIDGGEAVMVVDERKPARGLPPKEREKVLVSQLVGVAFLKKGRHFFKVRHAGEARFSNAFGLVKIELLRPRTTDGKRVIPVGSQNAPSPGAKEPWESEGFIPAPQWWRQTEVYAGYYKGLSEDALKRIKQRGFNVVVVGERADLRRWSRIADQLNLRLAPYVSFHTWRWRFDAEEGKEQLVDKDLLSSFGSSKGRKGKIRWLEYWALAEHPEWMLLDAQGKSVSPFGPNYQAGSIREPCLDAQGVAESCLALAKLLMDEGADGLFVDNVHPTGSCHGEELGLHKHLHPNWNNATAYKEMLRRVRSIVKRHGEDKIVILNSGGPRKFFADVGDALMWESFLFQGGEQPNMRFREQVLGAGKYWRSYIEAGGAIAALSYIGGSGKTRKRNAFYAYTCAKLCGFHFSDWLTADGTAGALYSLRLGKAVSDVKEHDGVWVRRFENGLVAVNPEGDGQSSEVVAKLPPRSVTLASPWRHPVDVYQGKAITVNKGKMSISVPALSGRVVVNADR